MTDSGRSEISGKSFRFWLVVAFMLHLGLGIGAFLFMRWDASRIVPPRVVSVNLVSLDLPGGGGNPIVKEESAPAPKALDAPEPTSKSEQAEIKPTKKVPEPKQPDPVVEKPAEKPVLPPKPPVPSKAVADAAAKKVAEKARDPLQESLKKISKSIDQKTAAKPTGKAGGIDEALSRLREKVAEADASGVGPGAGGQGGDGQGAGGTVDPYTAAIVSIINDNWHFADPVLRKSRMEVYVRIRVLGDGTIAQIVFDRKSPSEYLNNTVRRALEKSSPLPPPPPGRFSPGGEWMGFVFTPEGVER